MDWHADHIHPYSAGGVTDVLNGQALCPACNHRKGSHLMSPSFREWQNEQYEDFVQSDGQAGKKWYMLVATPGAGKTTAMLRSASYYLNTGQADLIVVVVPTLGLKDQWKKSARRNFNLQFLEEFSGYVNDEFHGITVTYSQVANNPEYLRRLHRDRKIVVILDEPHHMGENRTWGQGVTHAFENCIRGIMGSGTLFRSDNEKIPLIKYDSNGQSTADYIYSYEDALIDQICRAVFFRKLNVEAEWLSYNEEIVTANFQDNLNERQQTERLNTTLDAHGDWMKSVIQQAVNDIRHIRQEEQENAAMLIITKDTQHAELIANVYRKISGLEPVIVSSDKEAGHGGKNEIDAFKNSDDECIISVAMVSEGVDIPRLRSLIYATNKLTEMFFRQAIGRIVRAEKGRELLNGLCYIPSDARLLKMAENIKQERNHVLENVEDRVMREKIIHENNLRNGLSEKKSSSFSVISTKAIDDGGVYDAQSYTPDELAEAKAWIEENNLRISLEEGAKILRINKASGSYKSEVPEAEDLEAKRTMLSHKADRLAFRYAKLRNIHVSEVHLIWMREYKGKPHKKETISGFERKITWLTREIEKRS